MDMTGVNSAAPLLATQPSGVPPDQAAENRDVIRAVQALNATGMFGEDNRLTYQRDDSRKRMVVRVIDRKTGAVVSEVPPEYVLRLAEDLQPGEK